ncbi:MAG: hypothetical protein OXH64_12135, partial [Rhodospirillaceae bacterium]|nr:hypothetical protein [Rhodospirillaceae bacterium]
RWLWADTYHSKVSDEEARDRMNRIREEARSLVKRVDIGDDEKLNSKCWKETSEMESERYAT